MVPILNHCPDLGATPLGKVQPQMVRSTTQIKEFMIGKQGLTAVSVRF
jgi:hypothetical protein